MNLIHSADFELPVVSPETPVAWTSHEIHTAAQSGGDTFVRRMALEFPGREPCKSLKRALGIADELIEDAADRLGVQAIPRTWGLYKDPGNLQDEQRRRIVRSDLLPMHYFLVAEVPVISPARALTPSETQDLIPKLARYHGKERASLILGDLGSRQCVVGALAGTAPGTWLVDAEPRVRT